ncbi:DUF456 domain-containing protein [Aegicerativicinus sediminis]|uniref:DUF456 domain-containing protein n=1 Tax=Aegicerativicinus sediminis TaxID=2893202 RepID=UPI001E60AE54|nr:DUF456 domain-containing protein [Aegicerativicinus sediminis]
MDIILVIVAGILMIVGILGSFLPVLPGPPISWLGLLVLYLTEAIPMNWPFLTITFLIALAIFILDYIIPAAGTKKFGGSKAGMIGATIGLIVGLIAPVPGGIIIGPFLGALIAELINKAKPDLALKAAFGSFLGFLASTSLKFLVCVIYAVFYIVRIIKYSYQLF